MGPLRRVLAAIAERLIATKAPERLCYARLGDYARERPGLSARQLQELARVHRALAGLPALERALLANELPWSKVRLIARVATEQDEERGSPARGSCPPAGSSGRSGKRPEPRVGRSGRGAAPQAGQRALHARRAREVGPRARAGGARRRPAPARRRGARARRGRGVLGHLDRSRVRREAGRAACAAAKRRDGAPRRRGGQAALAARARPRGLPRAIASLAAGLDEADAFELDRRLRLAVRLEQTLDAAIAPLLRVVTSAEYEWRGDYCALASYAREQLGMSASKARALLRLERAGDVCPELRDAYRSGRLSWVKAQCLLPLLLLDIDGEWRPAWVAWAERVTVRRLAEDVERALLLRAGHHLAWQRCKFHPERAQDPIPPEERQLCAPDIDTEATQRLAWRVPRDVAVLFTAVRETLRSKLGPERGRWLTDGEVFDALLDCALLAWTLRDPRARRPDPVVERDGYRCAVPGCTSRRNLHDHHIRFRSAGGSDAPGNRITLCAFHHQRCLHAGLLRVSGRAPDGLFFELGLRPGSAPLVRYRLGRHRRSRELRGGWTRSGPAGGRCG